jgi:hypothetical protein
MVEGEEEEQIQARGNRAAAVVFVGARVEGTVKREEYAPAVPGSPSRPMKGLESVVEERRETCLGSPA